MKTSFLGAIALVLVASVLYGPVIIPAAIGAVILAHLLMRPPRHASTLAIALLLIVGMGVLPALAQSTVPVSPIYDLFINTILPPLAVVVAALLGWLALLIKQKTGLDIDAAHRATLQTAVMNAAGLVAQKVGGKLQGVNINVGNPLVAVGIQYVENAAPDALKRFGLTGEDIAEKIAAKLGVAMIAPATVSPAAAATGTGATS